MSEKSLLTLNKTLEKGKDIDVKLLSKSKNDIIKLFQEKISDNITINDTFSHEYLMKRFDYNCIILSESS